MNSAPVFSVIIPAHNKGRLLIEAIRSVESQTFRDYEIIVVDDDSTDDTQRLLSELISPCLRVFRRSPAGWGGYAARNLGIARACGRYVAFLDADDLWYPHHLQAGWDLIENWPEAGLYVTGFEEILGEHHKAIRHPGPRQVSASDFLDRYAVADCIHTNSVFVSRRHVLEVGGFPEDGTRRAGDHVLWLKLLLLGLPIAASAQITSCYRRDHSGVVANPANLSSSHPVAIHVSRVLAEGLPWERSAGGRAERSLKRLANRKALFWMLQRKRQGTFVLRELAQLYPSALTFRLLIRLMILLVVPDPLWCRLVRVRDHRRQNS